MFVVVPSTPPPSVEPLMGLHTPAVCVPPPPLLSVAVAVTVVVVLVVVFVIPPPPPPRPNALPSSSSYSMAGMAALSDRCCMQEVEVKKQI